MAAEQMRVIIEKYAVMRLALFEKRGAKTVRRRKTHCAQFSFAVLS